MGNSVGLVTVFFLQGFGMSLEFVFWFSVCFFFF